MRRATGNGHRVRWVVGSLAALSLLLVACGGGNGAPQASSNAGTPNPNGVLRVGVDLNDSFSNDFDPGTGTNDCSFQVLEQIYQSITFEPSGPPGNNEIEPGLAQSWTDLRLHADPAHPAQRRVLRR